MPTYDYECTDCGYEFEHFQAMSDEPLKTCPECSGKLRRLIGGGTGIIFKGSGFYVTDNGSSSKVSSKTGASSEEGGSKENTKEESKGESQTSKTETSKEGKPVKA